MSAPTRPSPSRASVVSAFAAVYLICGSTYLAIRFAVETRPPLLMAGSRFVFSGVVMYALIRLRGGAKPTAIHWRSAFIIGGLLLLGGNGAVTWAEQYVSSSVTVLMITMLPVWMVLLHWLQRDGRRPTAAEAIGVLLGFSGVAILVGAGDLGGGEPIHTWGAIVLLIAPVLWSIGSLYSRRAPLPESRFLAVSMEMLAGGGLLMLGGLVSGEAAAMDLSAVSTKSWISFAYLVVFGSFIAFTAYIWLLQVSTPARVSTYAFVNPTIAVLLGCTVGGEPFMPRFIVAAGIIVTAVVLITLGPRGRSKSPASDGEDARPLSERGSCELSATCTQPVELVAGAQTPGSTDLVHPVGSSVTTRG